MASPPSSPGRIVVKIAGIFAALALWWLVRKPLTPWVDQLRWVPIYVLGSLSAMWCMERGLEALA